MYNTRKNSFLNLITFLFTSAILLIALVSFATSYNNYKYRVYFYDSDELITTISKFGNKKISTPDLQKVQDLLGDSIVGYDINWSSDKNELVFVSFEDIDNDTYVYLHKSLHEYNVDIDIDESLNIIDIEKDKYKYGTNYIFKVENKSISSNQGVVVTVNNELLLPNENGEYVISKISSNLFINITKKEIVNVELVEDIIIYDGLIHQVDIKTDHDDSIKLNDFVITYYADKELTQEIEILNVNSYYVKIHYTGSEYYISDVVTKIEVVKAIPNVTVKDTVTTYDGKHHIYDINNITTNSDGKIKIDSLSKIEPGTYEVKIIISESANFKCVEMVGYLIINQIESIIDGPNDLGVQYCYTKLNEIDVNNLFTSEIKGKFTFENGTEFVKAGVNKYNIIFTPDDIKHYQVMKKEITIEGLAIQKLLDTSKTIKENIIDNYQSLNIKEIEKLPITTEILDSTIKWYSTSTLVSVDNEGRIHVLDSEGTFHVTLYAIIEYGETAEYISLNYEVINNVINETTDSIDEVVEEVVYIEVAVPKVEKSTTETVIITQNNTNENTDNNETIIKKLIVEEFKVSTLEKESTNNYHYASKAICSQAISEVILWKILSSEPIDDASSTYSENLKLNIYQKIYGNGEII